MGLGLALVCCGAPKVPPHLVKGCAPFQADQCLTPFPNAWFEQGDSTTVTDQRIVFPEGVLPEMSPGKEVDPNLFGRLDGYSPATPMIVWFSQGVDASQLAPLGAQTIDDRIPASLAGDSPIVLLELASRERVPFFAELDANANPAAGDRQSLLIHPMVRLQFAKRYVVAVRTTLRDASGQPLAPEGAFADWVAGKLAPGTALAELAERLDTDAAALASVGISKKDLALAWDFDTASQESTTGQLIAMRDETFAREPDGFGFTVTSTDETRTDTRYRIINGTFQAPSFETGPDPSPLAIDEQGHAVMGDLADWPFTALIPACAETAPGPLPILVMGHGLSSSAQITVSRNDALANGLCMVLVGTDWKGLSRSDVGTLTGVFSDLNSFPLVTSRLEQAHLNFLVLTRLMTKALGRDAALSVNGRSAVDPTQVYYWGESNGGIQGTTFLSLSPDVSRGVVDLVGAQWSLLTWRSTEFAPMLLALQSIYPDKLDQQVMTALTQSLWDKTDPIEHATALRGSSKQLLFRESVHDSVVSNIATRTMMRTLGASALGPLVEPVWQLPGNAGPLEGLVYAQWSVDPQPVPPLTNVPAPDNGGHYKIRESPGSLAQMQGWLRPGGKAVNPCGGPCLFE